MYGSGLDANTASELMYSDAEVVAHVVVAVVDMDVTLAK